MNVMCKEVRNQSIIYRDVKEVFIDKEVEDKSEEEYDKE